MNKRLAVRYYLFDRFLIDNKGYFYIKDILENIIGIIDQERNVVVYYRYDAYGKLLQEDIKINNLASKYNDILYKGYVYDRESELYYLKSRYYSPRIGRIIIMDEVSYVNPKDINELKEVYYYEEKHVIINTATFVNSMRSCN